jgi:hypothetical protein
MSAPDEFQKQDMGMYVLGMVVCVVLSGLGGFVGIATAGLAVLCALKFSATAKMVE